MQPSRPGFELGSPYPFPTMITITRKEKRRQTSSERSFIKLQAYVCVCVCVCVYLPNLFPHSECYTRGIFTESLTGLNSEFFFSETGYFTSVKEPSLPYYLLIAEGRIVGCITYWRVIALCQMQTASSRFLTRIAVSISNDDNHFTTSASLYIIKR